MGHLGNNAEIYTAIFTAALFIATAALAIIAWVQIVAARKETRKSQTLSACGQYDLNPVIFSSHRAILQARDEGRLERDARKLRLEITNILNFLDAIAIGIDHDLYVEDLAYNHLHSIVAKHVHELLARNINEKTGCKKEHYAALLALNARWQERNRRSSCPVPIPDIDVPSSSETPSPSA